MQLGDPRVLHGEVIKLQALTFDIGVPGGGVGSWDKSGAGGGSGANGGSGAVVGAGGAHGGGEDSLNN